MVRKSFLAAIVLVGIFTWSGCQTPSGGGCSGGSCGAGASTYAPATSGGNFSSSETYVPNTPTQGNYSGNGGSGTR